MTDLLRILVGLLVWLGSFSGVYALHGLACALGWGESGLWGFPLLRLILSAAWLAAIGLQLVVLAGLYSPRLASPPGFVRSVSRTTAWAGLLATFWSLFPVAATSSCQ